MGIVHIQEKIKKAQCIIFGKKLFKNWQGIPFLR